CAPTATEFVAALRERLREVAQRVDAAYPANTTLTMDEDGTPHLKRLPAQPLPDDLPALEAILKARLPERHLLDVLKNVQYWVGYTRHFGPPSGADPKLAEPVLRYLFTVFGYACELGASQTARPTTLYADTHGQAEPVFGLAALLGITLMPRMRTWNDVTFYRVDRATTYTHIDALFTQVVDWDVIERHWHDMMQVVLSIQAGTVLPSMLLQKLGVYSRQSSLYKAFSELGRVERTLFLLDYMSDATLRQQIRAETTKVESYHQFTDWIAFGGPVLRTGDPVEQEKRIKY